jgi:acetoin utilization deacetylase AcuC-like enzyme
MSGPRTGLVYDPIFLEHDPPDHPESPRRLQTIMAELIGSGLIQACRPVAARPASHEELELAHAPGYIDRLAATSGRPPGWFDPDTYHGPRSWDAAAAAAGGMIDLVLAVCAGRLRNGLILPRPPGHHARRNQAMGFCLLGYVGLGALTARARGGVARVGIVDFDVHHGNGTQDIIGQDSTVLYASTHQYPHFPGTGPAGDTGSGPATGLRINCPLPAGTGSTGFREVYQEIILPAVRAFRPELLIVSAGFDGHWRDPLAGLIVDLDVISWLMSELTSLAQELCEGRLVVCLEGGYDLEVLAHGVANLLRALLGRDETSDPFGPAPWPERGIGDLLARLREIHGRPASTHRDRSPP